MKTLLTVVLYLFTLCFISCVESENMCCGPTDRSLSGTWIEFERGYSPGAGYFTEPVPADPPQTITFESNGEFTTNIPEFNDYHFYRVLDDKNGDRVLALFKIDPGNAPQEISQLERSYTLTFDDRGMTLRARWCDEGCHLAFRLVDGES